MPGPVRSIAPINAVSLARAKTNASPRFYEHPWHSHVSPRSGAKDRSSLPAPTNDSGFPVGQILNAPESIHIDRARSFTNSGHLLRV